MTITALCPHCGFSRKVRDQLKGREAACPRCLQTFRIGEEKPVDTPEPTLKSESAPVPPPIPGAPDISSGNGVPPSAIIPPVLESTTDLSPSKPRPPEIDKPEIAEPELELKLELDLGPEPELQLQLEPGTGANAATKPEIELILEPELKAESRTEPRAESRPPKPAAKPVQSSRSAPAPPPPPQNASTPGPAPAAATATSAPTSSEPKKKVPNPLQPVGGFVELCPTLHTREDLDRYRAALLTPLQTPLEHRKMSGGYKLALFLTAIFMILLPIAYLAMILGLCALEYFYFVGTFDNFAKSLEGSSGKGSIVAWILYFSVPVALGAVILVMLKPLIFGWGGKDTRFEISPEREPLLFELIQHLCRFVGAPVPKRVFVNCDVNAYAGMTHGIRGAIFGGNACDLIIGLPLVAGMKTSELVGVLAHEFGHFTQAGTRRMDMIVRRTLHWFAHVYYYRDSMDSWLQSGAKSGFHYFVFFFWIVQAVVWTARRFIWLLMMLGNFVAGFMSRQMEFDADGFEIRLGGSERFPKSSAKLLMLSLANERTVGDLNYMLQEDRLADNYPLLIAANMEIDRERLENFAAKMIRKGKTGFFDSHPCDKDRIAAATEQAEPGVLHIDKPASLLFRNFLGLSREVSLHFYRNEVGLEFEPRVLKNSGAVIDQLRREHLGIEAVVQFFQRSYVNGRLLQLQSVEASRDVRDMVIRIRQSRDKQAGFAVDCLDAVKDFEKAETKYVQALYFRELVRIGAKADMSGLGFSFRKLGEANHTTELLQAQFSAQKARLWYRDAAAAERLAVARELLAQKEIQERIEDGEDIHRRMEEIYPILLKIAEEQNELDEARYDMIVMEHWIGRFPSLTQDQAGSLWKTIEDTSDLFKRLTKRLQMKYSTVPYPFEHGSLGITLGNFIVPHWNEAEMGPIEFWQAFSTLYGRLMTTYSLVLGECVAIALAVEQSLGLTPLPVPPPPEDEDEDDKKT